MESRELSRLCQLDAVIKPVKKIEEKLNEILTSLNWNNEKLSEASSLLKCPFDDSHFVSQAKFEDHINKCKLKQEEYCLDGPLLHENNEKANPCLISMNVALCDAVIKEAAKNNNTFKTNHRTYSSETPSLPATMDRWMSSYTSDERRAIYDYVISNRREVIQQIEDSQPTLFKNENKSSTSKSTLEGIAQSRDMKRRRTKYKVSTKSKTYTEVIREVILNQMKEYFNDIS